MSVNPRCDGKNRIREGVVSMVLSFTVGWARRVRLRCGHRVKFNEHTSEADNSYLPFHCCCSNVPALPSLGPSWSELGN